MGTRDGSYADILNQVDEAEALGYDAVFLGERHFRHYDLLYPSPYLVAAAIAVRTTRIRIGTAGRIITLDHPLHVAEEAATLDVISHGRLDFGVTRACLDGECHPAFNLPVDETKEQFKEALEVITRAWSDNAVDFQGAFYQISPVSVYPKPVQKPHPPIHLVAVSPETLHFAAAQGHSVITGAILDINELQKTADRYWGICRAGGNPGQEDVDFTVNRFIYVAATDAQAIAEIKEPFSHFIHHRAPDLKAALNRKYGSDISLDFTQCLDDFCLFGSPQTVTRRIREITGRVKTTHVLGTFNFVTMDHEKCVNSMKLFAEQVMGELKQ